LEYRQLGRGGREVSVIGFGVWTVSAGWWGEVSEEKAIKLLRRAYELGINFYDTADTYGNGKGETILAKALGRERDEIVIATKFGYDIYSEAPRHGHQERPQRFDPEFIRFSLEKSLERLNTDHVDLYQLHNPRLHTIKDEGVFETLEELKKDGKIGAYGVALGPAIGWFAEGEASMRMRRVATLQTVYNMLEQEPGCDFFPIARETGTGILVRVPHSTGLLEGHYTEDTTFPEGDHRSYRPREWLTQGLIKVKMLRFLERHNRTLGQAALKFILAEESVSSILPNIYDFDQLEEFARTPECPDITPTEMAMIQELYENDFYIPSAYKEELKGSEE
jgi:aryl-alcohol dehydrogenase-like predicted oxidoreductase